MLRKKLGNSQLEVSPICLGGNVFGWTADEKSSMRLLDAFVDGGGNFIDTADVYSRWAPGHRGGESETMIGRWLKKSGRRNQVVLATKVGMEMPEKGKGLARKYIMEAVEDSLRRLQTDFIDLYQSHQDDPDTPFEETLATFQELIDQGKVRAIGASNHSAVRLAEALRVAKEGGFPAYQTLQPLYNLHDREDFETELEPLCRREGLGVITYFSLASGFLTGKYRSAEDLTGKARAPMVEKYLTDRGMRIVATIDQVATELGSSPATVALAWLMAQPAVTAPIASATTTEQLATLLAAPQLRLDGDSLARLASASAP